MARSQRICAGLTKVSFTASMVVVPPVPPYSVTRAPVVKLVPETSTEFSTSPGAAESGETAATPGVGERTVKARPLVAGTWLPMLATRTLYRPGEASAGMASEHRIAVELMKVSSVASTTGLQSPEDGSIATQAPRANPVPVT